MDPLESPARRAGALDAGRLLESVYAEIRRLAHRAMARERHPATLQTTALVHEAWLRLRREGRDSWESRAQFFVAASSAMRRILVERARRRARLRHGGAQRRVALEGLCPEEQLGQAEADELLALDRALDDLRVFRRRLARIVELRIFAGMTEEETAAVLELSPRSVRRDWRAARLWLWQRVRERTGERGAEVGA